MNIKTILTVTATALVLNLATVEQASAASAVVKCETRGTSRSKISVDGIGFGAGQYRARVQSGPTTNVVWSKNFKQPVRGEVQFDFDSDPANVRAGATSIFRTFIKGSTVRGSIYRYNSVNRTYALWAAATGTCAAK